MTNQEENTTGLKASAYNYRSQLPDGTLLFFNFYTLNLLAFDPDKAALAQMILADPDNDRIDVPRSTLFDAPAETGEG